MPQIFQQGVGGSGQRFQLRDQKLKLVEGQESALGSVVGDERVRFGNGAVDFEVGEEHSDLFMDIDEANSVTHQRAQGFTSTVEG